jgi:hypothetical protein
LNLACYYWDHLLDKLTPANIKHWNPNIWHYQLISKAGWEDKKVTKKKDSLWLFWRTSPTV